jgi:hypothetical protein
MNHRLFMITGPGPGSGKSTLSAYLYRQLLLHDIPSAWFYEDDFLRMDSMSAYRARWNRSDPGAMDALLSAAQQLSHEHFATGKILITDALLPGFYWLLLKFQREEIEAYSRTLADTLQPLRPLLVYVDADPRTAFERAASRRGEAWADDFLLRVSQWPLPHYPEPEVRTREDLIALNGWLAAQALTLARKWPGEALFLNSTDLGLSETRHRLLEAAGLDRVEDTWPALIDSSAYIGTYEEIVSTGHGKALTISLLENELHVDAHWPAGSRLVAEAPDTFRLDSTSDVLQFIRSDQKVSELVYAHADERRRYVRTA